MASFGPGARVFFLLPSTAPFAACRGVEALIVKGSNSNDDFVDLAYVDPNPANVVNGVAPVLIAENVPSFARFAADAATANPSNDLATVKATFEAAVATNIRGLYFSGNETHSHPDWANQQP